MLMMSLRMDGPIHLPSQLCVPRRPRSCGLQGRDLYKRQKAEQEQEDDFDEPATTSEELLNRLEASKRQVEERGRHQAMMRKWNRMIMYGGVHASCVLKKGLARTGVWLHRPQI